MQQLYRLVLCAVALLPFAFSSAQAQWDRDRYYRGGYGNGTYQDTCTDARWDGSILSARCQKRDGGWRTSSIDSRSCGGQILNLDGRLACGEATDQYQGYGRPPYDDRRDDRPYYDWDYDRGRDYGYTNQGWRGGLPPGDYQLTCQNMRVEGDKLYATCEKRNGGWRETKLDFDRCSSPIANDNGRLTCIR